MFLFSQMQCLWAFGDENPYIVEDISAAISAKSPSEARNLAVKNARRDAFAILLARLSLEANLLKKMTDEDISDMVRSEQVIDEKIAGNNYSATFNITFAKDFVEHILAQKSLSIAASGQNFDSASLVVPVKILQRKILLWENSNDWRASINKALEGNNNFKIPVADIENVVTLTPENVNKITIDEMNPLFSKYNSANAYFLLFSQDGLGSKASVVVRIFNRDSGISQAKLNFANTDNLEGQDLLDKIAQKSLEYLQGLKNSSSVAQSSLEQLVLSLEIPITKLGDWLMIKNKIETSGFVSKLSVDAVSCDYVKASILLNKSELDTADLFAKNGFLLKAKNADTYLLTLK